MAKYKECSKTFGIFYDNFRRWCREMAARGELSDHLEEQFHLSSLDMAGSVLKVCVNLLGKVFLHL